MQTQQDKWRLERRVSVSALVQVVMLAGLIIGSWVNLQRQLDLLQRDVRLLLASQEKFCTRLERLQETTLSQEYRLRHLENQ